MVDPEAEQTPKKRLADSPSRLIGRLSTHIKAIEVLREHDKAEANQQLESLGATGDVEIDIMNQFYTNGTIAHIDDFMEAHAMVMRALEVLNRNRRRHPTLRIHGPFRVIAAFFIAQFSRMQIEFHIRRGLHEVGAMYRYREAQTEFGAPESPLLSRAADQLGDLSDSAPTGSWTVIKLFLGGAVISAAGGAFSSMLDAMNASMWMFTLSTVFLIVMALITSWIIVQSASIARRRIHLTLDSPLKALYEVMGGAGDPPNDPTRQFVLIAVVVLCIAWIIFPTALGIVLIPS